MASTQTLFTQPHAYLLHVEFKHVLVVPLLVIVIIWLITRVQVQLLHNVQN